MNFQFKTYRLGLPAMLFTAVIILPLVFVFLVFFAVWALVARLLLGRSFSKSLKGNTVFTRTVSRGQTNDNQSFGNAESLDKPVIEVEGHVIKDDVKK